MNTETKTFWNTEPGTPEAAEFHGQILAIGKRRFFQDPDEGGAVSITVTTVLVAGAIGDYAAYEGIGAPEWIKEYGNKLTFKEASQQFAGLDEKRYRR